MRSGANYITLWKNFRATWIDDGCIKKGAAHVHGMAEQFRHFFPWGGLAVGVIHTHAAQSDFRNGQAVSQLALFHVRFLPYALRPIS